MNVVSLFDGISCGQLALRKAGIPVTTYFASEVEKNAIKVTQHNFPDTIQLGDVTAVDGTMFRGADLLMGGSPCQGFSNAGKGLNFEDPRSALFFEFVRLKGEINPRYFLLENVNMKAEWRDIISQYLGVEPVRINSSDFVPALRDRWYWTNIPIEQWVPASPPLHSLIEWDVEVRNSDAWHTWWGKSAAHQLGKSYSRVMNDHEVAICQTARQVASWNGNLVSFEDGTYRFLTAREAERLQGVPDDYTDCVSDTARYHALGNGWTVDVIAHIFKGLKHV